MNDVKKITKTIEKTVYIASDGTEFVNEKWCLEHENELKQEKAEREIELDLGIKTHADYPSLLDTYRKLHDYKLFLIKK